MFWILFCLSNFSLLFSWCQPRFSLKISNESNEKLLKQKLCKTMFWLWIDFIVCIAWINNYVSMTYLTLVCYWYNMYIISNCWKGHLWRGENSNKISQSTKVKSCNLGLEIFVQYPPSTLFFLASNFLWLKRTCLIKLISLSIHHFLSTLIEACV